VKARLTNANGESRVVVREEVRAGGRVTADLKLRPGSKLVVRILEHDEWRKAIVRTT